MTSETERRFDNSGLFGHRFNNSVLCLSYNVTQEPRYGGDLDRNALKKLSIAVNNADALLRGETNNAIQSRRELVVVKLIGSKYQTVSGDYYSSDNEHRLNVGLEIPEGFGMDWTIEDFLNHSKRFIENVGEKVSDDLTHNRLPIGASENIDHYLRFFKGSS